MQIKPEQLQKFKGIYKEEFGIELSDREAYDKAYKVLRYGLMCLKPLPKLDSEE